MKHEKERSCLVSMALCGTGGSTAGDNSPAEAWVKYKSFKPVTLVLDAESAVPIPRNTKIWPGLNPHPPYYRETKSQKSSIQ